MAYFGYQPIITYNCNCFLLLAILLKQHTTQSCAIVTINSNSSTWTTVASNAQQQQATQCHGFYSQVKHKPINVCVNINTLRSQFYLFTLNCVNVTLVLSWFIAFIQMNHDSNSDFSFLQRMHSPQSLSPPPPQDTLSSHQHNYHNYTVTLHSLRISTEDKPVNLFLTS